MGNDSQERDARGVPRTIDHWDPQTGAPVYPKADPGADAPAVKPADANAAPKPADIGAVKSVPLGS